jgi:predicted metal-binding membrane protein
MAIAHEEITRVVPAVRTEPIRPASAQRAGVLLAAAGWAALVLMWTTGSAELFGHDQHGVPIPLAVFLFLAGWSVMIAAMMLPSSLPALRRLDGHAVEHMIAPESTRFLSGYFLGWAVFGAAAYIGDAMLHQLVHSLAWLEPRPWLIGGGVAIFAGLTEVAGRTPPREFPMVAKPDAPAFHLGKAHSIDRIRRCWPLMMFAMAVSMASALWMVALTLVMLLELRPKASWALRLIGSALVGMGIAIIAHPAWAPILLGQD